MRNKKILPIMSMIAALFVIFSTVQPVSVSAGSHSENISGWKQDCKPTSIGQQCGPKYKDHKIVAKWSKSDANKVANQISAFTGNKYGFAVLVAGLVNTPAGLVGTINGMAWNTASGKFYTAQAKGTGITYTYTYRLSQGGTTTTSGKVVSEKWEYK